MFPPFLPPDCQQLTEPASIALAQQMQRRPVLLRGQAIATSFVKLGGDSLPVLLLHGFDSSLLEFRAIAPLLAVQRGVWAVDLLGFGFTERSSLPVTPLSIQQHLYAFWRAQIQQPVLLIGASMGGAVAIDFALAHPQCVDRLVLIDSVGFSGSFPIGQLLVPPLDRAATSWLKFRKAIALQTAVATQPLNRPLSDAIRCALLHQAVPGWAEAIASFTRSGGYSGLADRVAQVQHPTLIVWGSRDDVLGTADAHRFRGAIAASQLVWLDCGHVPHLEQPQQTARSILEFAG